MYKYSNNRKSFPFFTLLLPFISLSAHAAVADKVTLDEKIATTSPGLIEHCDGHLSSFIEAFECGDELFEVRYNAVDGVV